MPQQHCCWGICQISKWSAGFKLQNHDLKTYQNLMIKHLPLCGVTVFALNHWLDNYFIPPQMSLTAGQILVNYWTTVKCCHGIKWIKRKRPFTCISQPYHNCNTRWHYKAATRVTQQMTISWILIGTITSHHKKKYERCTEFTEGNISIKPLIWDAP